MCCYFNIGIDAEIGASNYFSGLLYVPLGFERVRGKSKFMNIVLYILCGALKTLNCKRHPNRQIKQYVSNVKYAPVNRR